MKILNELSHNAICHEVTPNGASSCERMDYKHDDVFLGSLENVIHYMATFLGSDQCDTTILTNQIVSGIVSGQSHSSILTTRGDVFDASYVISTIPAGVLQNSQSIFLEPPLPYPLSIALQSLQVVKASIVHIILNHSIPHAIQEPYYTIPIDVGLQEETTVDLLNLNLFTGEDIIVLQANHKLSLILEKLQEHQVLNLLLDGIQTHFASVLEVKNSLISHWGRNPFSLGAYTKLSKTCSTSSDRATLRQPIGGRIILAGEWVASKNPGTIHGAFQSGVEQASLLLQDGFDSFELDDTQECLCEYT